MLDYLLRISIGFVCSLTLAASATESNIELALSGFYAGAELVEAGDDWWGVFRDGKEHTLQSTSVTVTSEPGDTPDSEGVSSAVRINSTGPKRPVFLIRGLSETREGPIATSDVDAQRGTLFPGQTFELHQRNSRLQERVKIAVTGVASLEPTFLHTQIRDYKVHLIQGFAKTVQGQLITAHPIVASDAGPRLIWVGDLDQDGKLDLLLDLRVHDLSTHLALFLSSAAKEGELVGLVAEWRAYDNC